MTPPKRDIGGVSRTAASLDDCGRVSGRLEAMTELVLEECESKRGEVRDVPPDKVEVSVKTRGSLARAERLVSTRVEFHFHAEYEDEGQLVPSASVRAAYLIVYLLRDTAGLDQRHIDAFAALQGPFNVWAFYREHLLSMSLKMGLPPLILPLNFDGMREPKRAALSASERDT
jgi:preprotein translocase subunit SecB